MNIVPEISVIIPTYNRFEMLERALNSVLSQRFKDFGIIAIDDASTDDTMERMQRVFKAEIETGRIKYVRNEKNQGRSACRNIGIKLAKTEFITFLDDDDYWLPEHLHLLNSFMNEHKNIGIAFSNWAIRDEQKQGDKPGIKGVKTGTGDPYLKLILRALIGYPSTCIIRKSVLEQTPWFNTVLPPREDWDFFTRCAMVGGIGFIDKSTVRIYVHSGSYSKNKDQWVNATEAAWNSITAAAQKYGVCLDNRIISERELRLSRAFISICDFEKAGMYLSRAVKHDPFSVLSSIALENMFKLLIGKRLYMRYKK